MLHRRSLGRGRWGDADWVAIRSVVEPGEQVARRDVNSIMAWPRTYE